MQNFENLSEAKYEKSYYNRMRLDLVNRFIFLLFCLKIKNKKL